MQVPGFRKSASFAGMDCRGCILQINVCSPDSRLYIRIEIQIRSFFPECVNMGIQTGEEILCHIEYRVLVVLIDHRCKQFR